ncbi:MAG: hemolysin family protein [Sandaracinaceae bacterium]
MTVKLLLTALFVFLNGFFVAAEFALVKVRPSRVKTLAMEGHSRAKRLAKMMEDLDLYLSACQLGITIASLVLGYLAEPAFAELMELGLGAVGVDVGDSAALHVASFGGALAIVTVLHMVLGEQAPKIWAIQTAERAALALSGPLWLFTLLLRPLILVVSAMTNGLLRALGLDGGHGEHDHDVRELKGIIGAAASAGNISARQREFAENILDLVELEVRHVMLPRPEVAYLDVGAPIAQSLDRIRRLGHSRWPLTRGGLDEVIGMILVRDLFDAMLSKDEIDLEKLARTTLFVPDSQPLPRFIVESQQTGHHAALVLDEHGTLVGMAFLEDALEEIVGPLPDERDEGEDEHASKLGEGTYEMDGATVLPEATELLGCEFDDDYATIGGLMIGKLGRFPRKGDKVIVGPYEAEVLRVGKRRSVARARFVRIEGASLSPEEPSAETSDAGAEEAREDESE